LPRVPSRLTKPGSAAAVLLAALCAAYAADAGHGFIKDDFRWIRETRIESPAEVARLFERTDGFYRPLVSLTFALNSAAFGLAPRAYGLTNFSILIVNALLLWLLARRLGLGQGPAILAAGVWAFNFHGINMSVLWISGRTALMVTLCALLAAIATAAARMWAAGLACLLAMLSKEEAVLLPVVLTLWSAYDARTHRETHREIGEIREKEVLPDLPYLLVNSVLRTWPCFAALAVYLVLRLRTDAFWPLDAPSYYRLSFAPATLAANVVQYADRAMTWPAFAALLTYLASARQAALNPIEKRIVVFGAIWLLGTVAITVCIPVRSSLYAVLPSVGSALAAAAVASAALRAAPHRVTTMMTVLAMLPVLLVPIYWQRNERWVRLADVSSSALAQVRTTAEHHPGRHIAVVDNPLERFNMESAFGNLWPDAVALFLPPGTTAVVTRDPPAVPDGIVLRLENGRLMEH
jgi:hypothetical protein